MIPKNKNIIGFDIVETAPNLDPSGYSTIVATLCLKELLLKFRRN
jgi:arginase family enzyme